MRSLKPDALTKSILGQLRKHPEGLLTQTISEDLKVEYHTIYQRLLRLQKRKYINKSMDPTKRFFWKITKEGEEWIFNAAFFSTGLPRTENKKSSSKPKPLTSNKIPPKRANGVRIYFKPYRTEYSKLPALLAEAKIHYRAEQVHNYVQYHVFWEGYELKFTTQKLIAYAPAAFYEFTIDGKRISNIEIEKACAAVASLLRVMPVRMLEEQGKLWVRCRYIEIAHTGSVVAGEVTQKKSYTPLAYDMKTGALCAWADRSFNFMELEFNDIPLEIKVANMMQDMKDGKWDPRKEKISREEAELLLIQTVQTLNKSIEANKDLKEIVLAIRDELKVHRATYQATGRVTLKLEKVLDKVLKDKE